MNFANKKIKIEKTMDALNKRFAGKSSLEITLKNGKEVIIAKNSDGYTLYEGCELVVGDVSLKYIAGCLVEMNIE